MLSHWQQEYKAGIRFTLWCVLILYTPVVVWSIGKAIYDDHEYFVNHARKQWGTAKQITESSSSTQRQLEGQISDWRARCAKLDGANGTLTSQNRDQQNSINSCQTEALKLLTPKAFQWKALALDATLEGINSKTRWLLIIDKPLGHPADIIFNCSSPISEATARIVSSPTTQQTARLEDMRWETKVSSPDWSLETPIVIDMTLSNPTHSHITCNFKLAQ